MNEIRRLANPLPILKMPPANRPELPAPPAPQDGFVASGNSLDPVHPCPRDVKPGPGPDKTPPPGDLGPGFEAAAAGEHSFAERLHDFIAKDPTGLYDFSVGKLLGRISASTDKGIGVDVAGLLGVERTLYQALATGGEGYTAGAPPLFQALADGQAAYVNLGKKRATEADHLMRMFSGLPLDVIEGMEAPTNDVDRVRQYLLKKAHDKEFPVYVDIDGKFETMTSTEGIATESIASIARRENDLGADFPDPRMYYKWLVTRVDSNYHRLDPWLFGTRQKVHDQVNFIKEHLAAPWVQGENNHDPFGSTPTQRNVQKAYAKMMEVCGDGEKPTWNTLTDVADAVINMDRDLLSGIQTYWIKYLAEISSAQRHSMMAPVARAWVNLNVQGPQDAAFERVSPSNAPYIELVDRHTGEVKKERYDRALALSQAMDHMVTGLGIQERRDFLDVLMTEIRAHQPELEKREARLRTLLGDQYRGLNINAILNDHLDINDPETKAALSELKKAAKPELPSHEMTPEYAEICRHRDIMDWVATRFSRYGDLAFDSLMTCNRDAEFSTNPLILGEFYEPPVRPATGPTPLPAGPTKTAVYGTPIPGRQPVRASVVLEGGGGKGFAFVQTMSDFKEALSKGKGQVAIDEFAGNSAGALTAGLLAAGYDGPELAKVLEELDFKKFYSDYLWLSGGVDPKVRGVNRTGLFSQQKMYKTIANLLKQKCQVEGRPVLFRDLPFKLKVTSTFLNGNVPEDIRKQLQLQPDGQMVFSSETTPNMDVAAAMCCSAAVPGFFNEPQLQVCTGSEDGKPILHRMQMADGGVVDNFPVSTVAHEGKSFLVTLPSYFQAPNPNGGEPITLSTLNFDSGNIGPINDYNKARFGEYGGHLMEAIQAAAEEGYDRAVIGMNLTDLGTQTAPIVQGHNRCETEHLLEKVHAHGLPTMDADAGAEVIVGNLEGKGKNILERNLLNSLLDKRDVFSPGGLFKDPSYRPPTDEAEGFADMMASVAAASMTAPSQLKNRLFEVD